MNSCGNGCGPMSNCGGHCTATSGSLIGCDSYCLHNSCGFNCGGESTISANCSSSSCSATR